MSTCSELLRDALSDLNGEIEPIRAYARDVIGLQQLRYALESVAEAYSGEWDSEESFAWQLLEDIGELPKDSLASRYFDLESFTRDLFIGDYVSAPAPGGQVYIFQNL